jgi:6-phosphofructokinase 1
MRRIGVLTSGGDGPGLNPCIRAVTRRALGYGFRAPEFKTVQGQREALRNLNKHNIEGLVVIGGNGSLTGALALHQHGFPVVGVPATIDNDVPGTAIAIGVDTALNTVLGAIDRIKDTASSHQRAFLIEVMGRDCGYLALMGGVAGGAEMVLIPEVETTLEEVAQGLLDAYIRGKAHCIIVVAEGYKQGCRAIVDYLKERREELGFDVRLTVLGYIQRGGSPTAYDRLLATRLGAAAVTELYNGHYGQMVGLKGQEIVTTPLEEMASSRIELDLDLYELAKIMEK